MTAPSILGKPQPDPDTEHVAIIRHIRFNKTLHGGWNEWSVACICGGLYETTSGGWFIPSRQQAERIFNDHAGIREGTPEEEGKGEVEPGDYAYLGGYSEDSTVYG